MWNILDHELHSTVGNSSNNPTIKQYTQLCSIQFHVNSKPSHQSDVKERISTLSEKLQTQTLCLFFLSFSDPREAQKSLRLYHIHWTGSFLTGRNYYNRCLYATVVSITNLKESRQQDYSMRYYVHYHNVDKKIFSACCCCCCCLQFRIAKVTISQKKQFKFFIIHFYYEICV